MLKPLATLLLCLVLTFPANASQRVSFSPTAPTPAHLDGDLTYPSGIGPFPAVVVLHSCLGLRPDHQAMADRLAGWGFASLFVDDFSARGLKDTCAVDFPEGVVDAQGGLRFLAAQPAIDSTRIAVLGYSQGAATALQLAAAATAPNATKFRAAAAYYPACAVLAGAALNLPTLILVGAADSVTPAAACQPLANQPGVTLMVYPGAGHVFDDPLFKHGKSVLGMWLQFNAAAAAQSATALHRFLAAQLAR